MNTLGKAKEFLRTKGKGLLPWLLGAVLLSALSQGTKISHGTGGGGEVDLDSVDDLSVETADGTRYYVIAVDPEGHASLVEVSELDAPAEPDEPITPTPIVQASPTTRTPSPTVTQPQPTPTPLEVTPFPTPNSPYRQVGAEYIPRVTVKIRSGPKKTSDNWIGTYATAGKRYLVHHAYDYADGSSWACIENIAPQQCKQWFAIKADLSPIDGVLETYADLAPQPVVWEHGHVRVGVHGPAPYNWAWRDGVNYRQIADARIEVVKLLAAGDVGSEVVEQLHREGVDVVIARVYLPITSRQRGSEAVREIEEPLIRLYQAGIRYFELGNEPNLYPLAAPEGMGIAWQDGGEFAVWWLDAAAYLRQIMPEAQIGFPAMSPGPAIENYRYPGDRFISEAHEAVRAADWIAFHTYWSSRDFSGVYAALREIEEFALAHADRVVLVTEFANVSEFVPMESKGEQYVLLYTLAPVELPGNVGALICFVLDNSGFPFQSWKGTEIAEMVGDR